MKLIIAGSRTISVTPTAIAGMLDYFGVEEIEQVVCGEALGIDTSGEEFAHFYEIDVEYFPCTDEDWKKYGRGAGHRRNRQMGDYATGALIIWDGESSGSKGMKEYMLKLNKPVYEVILRKHNV